jgi:gliding motility-associated-like protein
LEVLDSCPNYLNQIRFAKDWGNLSTNFAKEYCWAELMTSCCSNAIACGIPYSNGGTAYQIPKTGEAMAQLVTYGRPLWINERNYIMGTLKEVLLLNKSYCGKVFINLSNASKYKCNRFGIYFDNGTVLGLKDECVALNITPHIENNSFIMLNDTLGWIKIEGVYIANGTETKITLGNFYTDNTTSAVLTNFFNIYDNGVYNIDDISLIPIDIKAFAGNDITICIGDSIELGRPQEVGLDCMWYNLGNTTSFSNTSNFTFKATQTGVFSFVQKMDNCQISFDTVNVTVIQDCNQLPIVEPIINIPNTFSPNSDGINDVWFVDLKNNTNVSYTIYNRWGSIVKQNDINTQTFVQWDGRTTSGEIVTLGVYFYVLKYTDAKGEEQKKNGYISLFR